MPPIHRCAYANDEQTRTPAIQLASLFIRRRGRHGPIESSRYGRAAANDHGCGAAAAVSLISRSLKFEDNCVMCQFSVPTRMDNDSR